LVKFLANPIFLHGAAVLICASLAFVLGMVFMRLLRKSIEDEADVSPDSPAIETLPLHVYNTVIRQLKQQQDELKAQSQAEQQRSRTSEQFTQTVLASLSCGVLSIAKNGLVKSSNMAAKQILGFASPVGMSLKDIFRSAAVEPDPDHGESNSADLLVADVFESWQHSGGASSEIQAEYKTPAGEHRSLAIRMVPVPASDGVVTGTALLVNDMTELKRLRNEVEGEQMRKARAAGRGA
jgi:nitrogen fixation/metabolism regulation signal transduction histidine kinase